MRPVGRASLILLFVVLSCTVPVAAHCQGLDKDDFREAKDQAEKGDKEAEYVLGVLYDSGKGVPQNFMEALNWYRKAANQGHAAAQNNLGVLYLRGQGVEKDYSESARWIRMAADQGYAPSQMNLGLLFIEGTGVRKSYADGVSWITKAANQGDADAQRRLGTFYSEGKYAQWNFIEGYKWLTLAAAQGDEEAATDRDDVAGKMTSQALAQAQKMAADFVPQKSPESATRQKATGTGFFITKDGYVLTANHVVKGAVRIVVKTKYTVFSARLIKGDDTNDVALLKIVGILPAGALTNASLLQTPEYRLRPIAPTFRPLPIADSDAVSLGDSASTVGFPNIRYQGSEPKFTRGEINSLTGVRDDARHFQTSAQIQPGNSGGPLLDRFGNTIGIMQATLAGRASNGAMFQNVNYALKSALILSFLQPVPGLKLATPLTQETQDKNWISDVLGSVAVVIVY